jgi:phosphoribosylglycinamide formyltransferase-1
MRALAEQSRAPNAAYSVVAVLSDQVGAAGLRIARDLHIDADALPAPKGMKRADYDRSLAAAIEVRKPALIVLAGFMRILSAEFVMQFSGRMLNIHPSLLPKYPGLHTHRRVLESGDPEHGATVHFVTEQLDGGPAILQARVRVLPDDTEDSLAARVQVQEHLIYPLAVNWFCSGRLRMAAGQAWLDGQALTQPLEYSAATASST